jgi:hypothetical protein
MRNVNMMSTLRWLYETDCDSFLRRVELQQKMDALKAKKELLLLKKAAAASKEEAKE